MPVAFHTKEVPLIQRYVVCAAVMVYTMLNHWFVVTTTGALLKVEIAPKLALLQSGTEPVTLLNPPRNTQTHESLASELLVLTASCIMGEFEGP